MVSKLVKTTISLILSVALVAAYPAGVLAEGEVVCPEISGTTEPTGASGWTYSYNAEKCIWENDYYTWDPVTKIYAPKYSTEFVYNPASGNYEYTKWVYNTVKSAYEPVVVVQPISTLSTTSNSSDPTASSISNTGPDSSNSIDNSTQNNALLNLNYDARIDNMLSQYALTGDASVLANTTAGSALTGNATDVTNVMNLLQSTFGLQPAADMITFTANIDGDVVGDLLLDPSQINTTGPDSSNIINNSVENNLTINSQGSGLINNDITLDATSGDATVSQNTYAGDATSGNANAVANIVNIINSAIAAGQSFLGVININGNLDGDILLPPNFLDQLIASGAPQSTINLSQQQVNNLVANIDNNQTINNDVNLTAVSGDATVSENTNAGSATSGDASTNLTVFNLTGSQVLGANSLMVFVNVLGEWVGLIMNAPAGSTSAALCGGSCQISSSVENNALINDTSNNTINNNLRINSLSGDATVSQNTNAGSATSGDATASANLANIINSQLSLTDWFGILFINVFGTWHGSFGVNTDAGTIAQALNEAFSGGTNGSATSAHQAKVFQFIPKTDGNFTLSATQNNAQSGTSNSNSNNFFAGGSTGQNPPAAHDGSWLLPIVGAVTFMAIVSIGSLAEYGSKLRDSLLTRRLAQQPSQRRAWYRFTIF